ncbi:MAG: type III pantothenate kinase [Alphaproteobacteria bacterium]|nr:type III pantothenate kinase [Alphaproteobacteria bacterium]
MLLAIDIGNTNTVFAVYDGDILREDWRCVTEAARSPDEYAAFTGRLFDLAGIERTQIAAVIVSSVVPEADFQIRGFCRKYLEREPIFVTPDKVNVEIDLDRPEEVGADRLVNAVAVKAFYRTPAIVIDFGTATTFDVIDARGAYAGGVIAPGINLSIHALHSAASKLPRVSVTKPERVIGKNTVQAMQSGVYWGYTGLIEGIVQKISEDMKEKPLILATGGLALLFATDSSVIDEVDGQLTLKGLLQIYKDMNGRK